MVTGPGDAASQCRQSLSVGLRAAPFALRRGQHCNPVALAAYKKHKLSDRPCHGSAAPNVLHARLHLPSRMKQRQATGELLRTHSMRGEVDRFAAALWCKGCSASHALSARASAALRLGAEALPAWVTYPSLQRRAASADETVSGDTRHQMMVIAVVTCQRRILSVLASGLNRKDRAAGRHRRLPASAAGFEQDVSVDLTHKLMTNWAGARAHKVCPQCSPLRVAARDDRPGTPRARDL